eukprot:TRINITY_DN39_c0_g1_i1.p1 TRINITY_DN39_c0_g1~~TRINITY_DN39_c0_g1_i1.p1  ORF type:complete len:214 (-),score=55.16 TRINITY_DN39_c0_g1_i1:151-792(-)
MMQNTLRLLCRPSVTIIASRTARSLPAFTQKRFYSDGPIMDKLDKDPQATKITKGMMADEDLKVFKDASIQSILDSKQKIPITTVKKDETVYNAIKKMNSAKVGALAILNDNGEPIGMFSERDYLNKVILRGYSSKEIKVEDVMTTSVTTVQPTASAGECMDMMTQGRFRHIPVVDGNKKMIGIVSIGDLVKCVLDQQKETISFLQEYIGRTY